MKKVVAAIALSVVALSAWLIYSKLERSKRESLAEGARREAAHRAELAPYQRDLPIGTSRAEVDKYLDFSKVTRFVVWGQSPADGASYEISRAVEPGDGFVCDRWNVSIALEFKSSAGSPKLALPSDTLREVHIKQIGHCL